MDHLPLPSGVQHFIVAPYETPKGEWYDNRSFLEYPDRMGWGGVDLLGAVEEGADGAFGWNENGVPRKTKEIENFFQTWLYFGFAIETLGIAGIQVTTEDFLKKELQGEARIISTDNLPGFLNKWCRMTKSDEEKEELWLKLTPIFEREAFFLNRFCPPEEERHPSDRKPRARWPVRDEISTTMIAIACAIHQAARHVCGIHINPPGEHWPSNEAAEHWLKARSAILDRRLERKWCLADAALIEDEFQIDGHYFFAAAPSPGEEYMDRHPYCTRTRCHSIVDEAMYVTKHAQPPWHKPGCNSEIKYGGQLGPERGQKGWVDAVCKIIDKKVIPIAMWNKQAQSLVSVEYHFEGPRKPHYIAISHVWADGKGNPHDNTLPQCQIERIQHLVENVEYRGRRADTSERTAKDAVGFWMDTLCIPVQEENKQRRNEAIASMRHVYKNATCVLILDSWIEQIASTVNTPDLLVRLYGSNWIKRLWTHQEGFFPKQVFVQFSDRAVDLEDISAKCALYTQEVGNFSGIYLQLTETANSLVAGQYTYHKEHFMDLYHDEGLWQLYKPLSEIMGPRQTTRMADETICLATILDFPLAPFLAIDAKPDATGALERMKHFLTYFSHFNSGIIFNNYDRLEAQGYGWAPRSLLGHSGDRSLGIDDGKISFLGGVDGGYIDASEDEVGGLLVRYPGFKDFDFSDASRESIRTAERAFAIEHEEGGLIYMVEARSNEVAWNSWDQYCIILSKVPEEDERVLAVIGLAAEGDVEEGKVNIIDHLCLAEVRITTNSSPWVDTVSVPILGGGTEWLVR